MTLREIAPEELKQILADHALWLAGKGGARANLSYANLRNVNLSYADLRNANLSYADLSHADLSYADLRNADLSYAHLSHADLSYADLRNAYLRNADLRDADLSYADLSYANLRNADLRNANLRNVNLSYAHLSHAYLSYANLSYANLRNANLRDADLRDADLSYADLLCLGDMRCIRTMQFDTWLIGYTSDILQIGCQSHPIDKWRKWDTGAGRKWISQMDEGALAWADRNLSLVLQIIGANPAEPTGYKDDEQRGEGDE